ncbi:MAG: type II toxin-antitoxin system RelE/ParE family toxin [Cyclobacteriaceae bacterium]
MARKVEWTKASVQDRFEIYQFWVKKNKTDSYSKKIEKLFIEAAKLISEFPEIGIETDFPGLRVKVVRSYKLFYSQQSDVIRIIRIWDTRQNPQKLELPS